MTPDNIQWTRGVMINDVSWSQTVNESDLPLTDSTSTFLNSRGLKPGNLFRVLNPSCSQWLSVRFVLWA